MQLKVGLPQRFADGVGALLGPNFPERIGLAVSGGGDSMAMMHLAAGWARTFGIRLRVATVDHGLREGSAAEAEMVKEEAAGLGLPHQTLHWKGWDQQGNLQSAARDARMALIAEWRDEGEQIFTAHTMDDQAETVLMRMARGSGVDGLSGIPVKRNIGNWTVYRPMLGFSRAELRHYLGTLRIPFVDDPSNSDEQFARVRMRRLIGSEGLDVQTLAETASRLADARCALERRALEAATDILIESPETVGSVVLDRDGFVRLDKETQNRILAGALQFVAQAQYRPRYAPLNALNDVVSSGGSATLIGAIACTKGPNIYMTREFKAIETLRVPLAEADPWDNRLEIKANDYSNLEVAPLGAAGYRQVSPKPKTALPMPLIESSPALWRNNELVACNALSFGPSYSVKLSASLRKFPSTLVTH